MKIFQLSIIILFGVFVIIQFIPVDRPEYIETTYNFSKAEKIPDDISILLVNACFDCHSNQVRYPWYSFVAPVSWLVAKDVRKGKKHLNFSVWGTLSKKEQLKVLDKIADEVKEGEMPMKIYPYLHPEARLSDADRQKIVDWSEKMAEKVFEE